MNVSVWLTRSLAVAAFVLASPSGASEADDLNVIVQRWTADLNAGNMTEFFAACAPRVAVVDGFPPYAWRSCQDWMRDYEVNNRRTRAARGTLSIGAPLWIDIVDDRAYLSYAATFSNVQDRKPAVYKGMWAVTMAKTANGWKITGAGSAWGSE